jgi:hypothetical protein
VFRSFALLLNSVAAFVFFLAPCARLGADPASDPYGAELLAAGLPLATLLEWAGDPTVVVEGNPGSLFDAVEDLSAPACTAKAVAVFAEQAQRSETPIIESRAAAAAISAVAAAAISAVVAAEDSVVADALVEAESAAAVAATVAVSGELSTKTAATAAAAVETGAVAEAKAMLPSSPSGSGINAARALSETTE